MVRPQTTDTVKGVRAQVRAWRAEGLRVALVPTMGFLHAGHLSLVTRGLELCDRVVATIYVNPTQFGAGEDLESYPRDEEGDLEKLGKAGTHLVYFPKTEEIYPAGSQTVVEVTALPQYLCGRSRPTHFQGVTTICSKLFHIVGPDVAVFGEKDYQQLQIIRRMVRDLHLPLHIEGVATGRNEEGLALSSRNAYLSKEERKRALSISQSMKWAQEQVDQGEESASLLRDQIETRIREAGGDVDYVEIVDPETLAPVQTLKRPTRIAIAARFGPARLIDNAPLLPNPNR